MKVLDLSGLQYLWSKIKAKIPTKVSDLTNDSGFISSTTAASTYVAQSQGAANSGKFLGINSSGNVTPTEIDENTVIFEPLDFGEDEDGFYVVFNGREMFDALRSKKNVIIMLYSNWDVEEYSEPLQCIDWGWYDDGEYPAGGEADFVTINGTTVHSISIEYNTEDDPESDLVKGYYYDRPLIDFEEIEGVAIDTILGSGRVTLLEENYTLNRGAVPEIAVCRSATIAATLLNSPVSDEPFRMETKVWDKYDSNGYIVQSFRQVIYTDSGKVFVRHATRHPTDIYSYIYGPWQILANPTTKTAAMTQAVGIDSDGTLWTTPSQGGAVATIKVWTASDVEGDD